MTASPEMLSLRPKEGSILTCRGRELYLSRSAFEANARAWRRQEEVQREARIQEYVDLDEKDVFFFEDFLDFIEVDFSESVFYEYENDSDQEHFNEWMRC